MTAVARERRVLHVVESYGGGVASALDQYVRATPELEHHLIRAVRPGTYSEDGEHHVFATVSDLPSSPAPAVRAIQRRVKQLDPGVVHAHSSFGGAFARVAASSRSRRMVYTAHCYSMERLDLSRAARRGFGALEWVLARNTTAFAGCSEREVALGRRLAPAREHVWLVNVTDVRPPAPPPPSDGAITAMGRLGPQHDPRFFADLVTGLRRRGVTAPARWIGGGPEEQTRVLLDAGVEVTGWLPRSEALDTLTRSALYVHTGVWDGSPMALLEAVALEVPVLARRSRTLDTAPRRWVDADVATLVERAAAVLLDVDHAPGGAWHGNRADWAAHFADHTVPEQRLRLLDAYGMSGSVPA